MGACLYSTSAMFSYVTFFSDACDDLLNTYLVTNIALYAICEDNMNIREENLINELHLGIKQMFMEGMLDSLQSCLKVTIKNAIHSFIKLGMAEIKTYVT